MNTEFEDLGFDVNLFLNGITCRSEKSWNQWSEEAIKKLFAHLTEIVLKQRKRIHFVADSMPSLPPS